MKKLTILFSIVMAAIIIIISCNKKNDDPVPVERKKCAWVVGWEDSTGYGMILYSADAGETWVRQGQGSTALQGIDVDDIWALDENNVWATGTNNVILRTINGGQTWSRIQAPANIANTVLMSISIIDNTNIWISGGSGIVYNSIDGGSTWTMFDTSFFHCGGMQGIWAINPQVVYVVGGISKNTDNERGFVGYTQDGGATWDSVFPANNYNKHEWIGVTASGNTIVVYGVKSHYMVSTDGGTTWKNDSIPGTGGGGTPADINHLIMLNSQIWWGSLDMGQIYLTTDGGSTWASQLSGQGGKYLVGIDAWDSQLALAVGMSVSWPEQGPILKTSNGGAHWEVKHTYNSNLNKVSFIKK
ncbi:MAG: hypothetical protein KAV44_10045 [Bacteroidales bacterium]|nr:hypothetical protein [Bacteroidales bacterium]